MVERSRPARLREICAPWLVPGLALSAASAIGVPLANSAGTAPEGRVRAGAKASAEVREAVRITAPGADDGRPQGGNARPAARSRPCRPGDAPIGAPCRITIVDMP